MKYTSTLKPLALIIEDDSKLAEIYSQAVRKAGFSCKVIGDGNMALQYLCHVQPVLIILDLHLPSVPGDEILHIIRTDRQLSSTRVIITTADAEKAQTLVDASDLVLVKPVSFSQLRDLAARLGKN